MLLPQIPGETKKKVALDLKIDLKVFSAARRTESATGEERICRLLAVVDYINNNENVGNPDQPHTYFAGTLHMRWGPFGAQTLGSFKFEDLFQIVYFSGETNTTLVGLGGSAKHVIGNLGPSNPREWGGSSGPILVQLLMSHVAAGDPELKPRWDPWEAFHQAHDDSASYPYIIGRRMTSVYERMGGPEQRLEFLAKRIFAGTGPERPFVLGTPLYVALAE